MLQTRYLIVILCLSFYSSVFSNSGFRTTPDVRKAYNLVFALKLDAAEEQIELLRYNDPTNLMADYVADFVDFFKVFINEDKEQYLRLRPNRSARLEVLKHGDSSSPYHLFAQAEVHLHWALIKFKFEENIAAAIEINRAFKLLKRNVRRFPEFAPNYKSLGMLRAGVGTIPDKYRWAVKLLSSLEGTIEEGLTDMKKSIRLGAEQKVLSQKEAHYFYAMALLHFGNDGEAAWEHLNAASLTPSDNLVDCFMMGNVAMKTGRIDEAILLYSDRPVKTDIHRFPYLDFSLGLAKLYRNDSDADVPLLKYVHQFNGLNYIKEAYQKLAWHYLIHGDEEKYRHYMKQCVAKGAAITDEDKHALREALNGIPPHPGLLRARLLFDGGNYQEALTVLQSFDPQALIDDNRLEHSYRLGRVCHALALNAKALNYYDQTISSGSDSRLYFACNAALQSGLISESSGQYSAARRYFKTCLDLKPSDFQSSLHQKAKAGLNRMKSKI